MTDVQVRIKKLLDKLQTASSKNIGTSLSREEVNACLLLIQSLQDFARGQVKGKEVKQEIQPIGQG